MISLKQFDREFRDFQRDYTNTIVEFFVDKNPDVVNLLNIAEIHCTESGSGVSHVLGTTLNRSKSGAVTWSSVHYQGREITIRDWFPEARMYAYHSCVMSLSYYPTRQYGRSFNRNIVNARFTNEFSRHYPTAAIYRGGLVNDPNCIYSIYENKQWDFDEGIGSILDGNRLAFPMFDYFYCLLSPYEVKHPLKVCCEDTPIGYVDLETKDRRIMLYKEYSYLNDVFKDNDYDNVGVGDE